LVCPHQSSASSYQIRMDRVYRHHSQPGRPRLDPCHEMPPSPWTMGHGIEPTLHRPHGLSQRRHRAGTCARNL
jgi:hypothetical protein